MKVGPVLVIAGLLLAFSTQLLAVMEYDWVKVTVPDQVEANTWYSIVVETPETRISNPFATAGTGDSLNRLALSDEGCFHWIVDSLPGQGSGTERWVLTTADGVNTFTYQELAGNNAYNLDIWVWDVQGNAVHERFAVNVVAPTPEPTPVEPTPEPVPPAPEPEQGTPTTPTEQEYAQQVYQTESWRSNLQVIGWGVVAIGIIVMVVMKR